VEHEAEAVPERRQPPQASAVLSALQIVCAWCQRHIVWHRVPTPMAFPISYSICARCYTDVAREFAPRRAGAASRGLRVE
jgi:hypothetical protein